MQKELKNPAKNTYMIAYWKANPDKYRANIQLKKDKASVKNMYSKIDGMLSNRAFQVAMTQRIRAMSTAEKAEFIAALQLMQCAET